MINDTPCFSIFTYLMRLRSIGVCEGDTECVIFPRILQATLVVYIVGLYVWGMG